MAWRGASSFSPFKLNPSLNLSSYPPFYHSLFLSLKRKNSEDPLEMQNRPIFFNSFSLAVACQLSSSGVGVWAGHWFNQHRSYGRFCIGLVSSGKGLGARRYEMFLE